MTTVAVRDDIMAADTQGCFEGIKMKLIKIFRIRNNLIGICGNYDKAVEFIELYRKGERKELNGNGKDDEDFDYLLLNESGVYLATGFWGPQVFVHEPFFAIGSGKASAITAMRMGASAKEAIKMAHLNDMHTGGPITVRKL